MFLILGLAVTTFKGLTFEKLLDQNMANLFSLCLKTSSVKGYCLILIILTDALNEELNLLALAR